MERISSRQNPIVKRFRDLARIGGDQSMLLEGAHLVEEALRSGIRLELVALADRAVDGAYGYLVEQAQHAEVKVVAVTDPVMSAISPVRQPSGVVGIAARPQRSSDVFSGDGALVVVLGGVQDPGNVGAIVRAAEACGATAVVAADATADPFGWKALRGAMGSTFRVPIGAGQPLKDSIQQARAAGLRIFAAVARDGRPLRECDLRGPSAILLGGEGPGLGSEVIAAADERLTVPMRPPVESLNVAIAAALILYEALGQRR